jgi:hypothetical protein
LFIDGKELTRIRFGDDAHQPHGRITLDAGMHSIRVDYYEEGGGEHLRVWWGGPNFSRVPLFGTNPGSHWSQEPGGRMVSDTIRASIFREVELPEQFELDVEFAASESPRFALAIAENESSAASDNAFRLETWDDELVAVQGAVFEPLVTIEEGRNDVHLRLAFDTGASTMEVFDSNGLSLVTVEGIQPATGTSGIFVSNRGSDLTIRRLGIFHASPSRPNLTFDGSQLSDWHLESDGPIKDLTYKAYKWDGGWLDPTQAADVVDFSELTVVSEGGFAAGYLDIELSGVDEGFAMSFEGRVEVAEPGEYKFDVSADDVARIYIDDNPIFGFLRDARNNAGVELDAGSHSIRVDYIDYGRENRLDLWMNGMPLSGTQESLGWVQGFGGHAKTDREKGSMFRTVEIPEAFDIDIDFASSARPQFVLAIGNDRLSATSNQALRLETWDDELVVVQGNIFEPVMTFEEGRRDVRLRLAFDKETGELTVFDSNGNAVTNVKGVQPITGESGIYISNRGEDLTVRRLSVYRQSEEGAQQPVDSSKARVHLIDGQVRYGRLHIEEGGAYVLDQDGTRQDTPLGQIDRIATPNVKLLPKTNTAALSYADGAFVTGQVERANLDRVILRTAFSDAPLICALAGAASLRFNPPSSSADPAGSDSDQLVSASGGLRGSLSFDLENSPLSWKPEGAEKPLQLAIVGGARIERSARLLSRRTYDESEFPFGLHLKNGEIVPCHVTSYDEENITIKSPYFIARQIQSAHIKAITFKPLEAPELNKEPLSEIDQWLKGIVGRDKEKALTADRVKLDRALIVPRFNRDSPPEHILMANNGDLKRGKLLSVTGEMIEFESKLKKILVPIDHMAQVVNVSDPDADEEESEPITVSPEGTVRANLTDGSILVFEPIESRDGKLWGRSPIYGAMSVPLESIRDLSIGDFEKEKFESLFGEWVVRPGKEPEFGELVDP